MIVSTRDWILYSALASAACFVSACGGGDDEPAAEEKSSGSLSDITGAIESPTGTIDETTAADVARAFEDSAGVPTGGSRDELAPLAAQDTTVPCSGGGEIAVSADSSGESSSFSYDACCEGGCCMDGTGTTFVDTSGTAAYSVCATVDLTAVCDGVDVDYEFSYCSGSMGLVYSVEVEGDTFAVSGSVSNGTGTLTITGQNGSYTCEYTEYAGSCQSDTGESFTF